jgi:hypothetical protein
MELDIMWKSRIENKVLLRQMGAGLVDTKRVLINNGKIKTSAPDNGAYAPAAGAAPNAAWCALRR